MRKKLVGIAVILHVSSCLLFSALFSTLVRAGERNLPVMDGPGHDGSSASTAIVVEADTEDAGVNTEYLWMAHHYPNRRIVSQSLTFEGGRAYDILEIEGRDGTSEEIYFDITSFYGKW
jgi:hypothetical protein